MNNPFIYLRGLKHANFTVLWDESAYKKCLREE